MKQKSFSQLYNLNREIEMYSAQLSDFERDSQSGQASETMEIIATLQDRAAIEYKRLLRAISSAPDSLTRQILTYRYINGLPWAQVAVLVGGDNTPDGVRKIATRYIIAL